MERRENRPEQNKPIDPAIITAIVFLQLEAAIQRAYRKYTIDNMNA